MKPFSDLVEKMSPEAQAQAKMRTREMLDSIRLDIACQAFYEAHGQAKWGDLLVCWKDNYRKQMRAALDAYENTRATSAPSAGVDEVARDAERYRWLREEQATITYKRVATGVWEPLVDSFGTSTRCKSLDEAIDKAIAAGKGE